MFYKTDMGSGINAFLKGIGIHLDRLYSGSSANGKYEVSGNFNPFPNPLEGLFTLIKSNLEQRVENLSGHTQSVNIDYNKLPPPMFDYGKLPQPFFDYGAF